MNDRFKFRVWDIFSKQYLIPDEDDLSYFYNLGTPYNLSEILSSKFHDRFIVQQWTGLKDTEGNEIYEGDILCAKREGPEDTGESNIGKVYFASGTFFIDGDGPLFDHIFSKTPDILEDYLVIGNINENPDLLL